MAFTFAVLDWHEPCCVIFNHCGLEAELQVFAHCPSAWPTHDLYSNFLLKRRKQGWYPASLYSLAYPPALQIKAPTSVRCEGDCWDQGTKQKHWEVIELHSRRNQGWRHAYFTEIMSDKHSYHLGPLRAMPSSPTHFKINWRDFDQNQFLICTKNDLVLKISWFSSHKGYIISIFYSTSAYSNLVFQSTAHELILNFTKTPMINCSTSGIYMALQHPPTHQKINIGHNLDT